MSQPNANLTLCTAPHSESGETEMYLSEPEKMEDGDGDWGFAAYQGKDVWMATLVYPSQHAESRAREAMIPALRECTFIATAES